MDSLNTILDCADKNCIVTIKEDSTNRIVTSGRPKLVKMVLTEEQLNATEYTLYEDNVAMTDILVVLK